MILGRTALTLATLAALTAGESAAQSRLGFGAAGMVGIPTVRHDLGSGGETLSGTTVGGTAFVRFAFIEVGGRYLEGSIENAEAGRTQDIVEGAAVLLVRPIRPVSLGFGPRARSYVEGGGTERWVTWEARAGLDAWLLPRVLRSTIEVSLALGGSESGGASIAAGRGIEGGLDLWIPRTPLFVGVAYRVDQARLDDDTRRDTVEQFLLRVGIGR